MADVIAFLEVRITEDESAARGLVLNLAGADDAAGSGSPLCPVQCRAFRLGRGPAGTA